MSRPQRDGITAATEEAPDVLEALAAFDRMSEEYGRPQAMREVLVRFGRR